MKGGGKGSHLNLRLQLSPQIAQMLEAALWLQLVMLAAPGLLCRCFWVERCGAGEQAGEGEDGRMKSAIGIGALLMDGLGDTIRVSLTEDPELEIVPCGCA